MSAANASFGWCPPVPFEAVVELEEEEEGEVESLKYSNTQFVSAECTEPGEVREEGKSMMVHRMPRYVNMTYTCHHIVPEIKGKERENTGTLA